MAIIELNKDNLQTTIANSSFLVIDFWADWCQPCKAFAPVFEKAAEKYEEIAFAKCDTQNNPEVAAAFGVQSIPTIAVFRDQILLYQEPGALPPPAFDELIQKIQALDVQEIRTQIAQQNEGAPAEEANDGALAEEPAAESKSSIKIEHSESGLSHLADDAFLRRQGVTSEFVLSVQDSKAPAVAAQVLGMYQKVRKMIQDQGAQGRKEAAAVIEAWAFDPKKALQDLDPEIRSEILAVTRAIQDLLRE